MEFKISEVSNGFIIEDKNGDKAVISLDSLIKKSIPPAPSPSVQSTNADAVISIVKCEDGNNLDGVRVQALGEDFIIGLKDIDDGKDDFNYDQAMKRLKELKLDTFNRKQGFIIAIYIEEINAKLVEAGGDKFADDLYISNELWHPVGSSADYIASRSWSFYGGYGCFNLSNRYGSLFRSRPVLAYNAILS